MANPDQTVNVPQLLILIILGGLAVRYFFFTPSSSSPSNPRNSTRAREQDVETIQQMFPQVSRRSIMWNLQRNGGNVAATTERILSGQGLEEPPQSFQPPPPPNAAPSTNAASSSTSPQPKPAQPDLITRYNLQSKLEEEERRRSVDGSSETLVSGESDRKKQGPAWSQNKGERQALLQKRREEMILNARRKMEEKLARDKAGTAA